MSSSLKRWVVKKSAPDSFFAQFPDSPTSVLQLLWNREIKTQEEMEMFFHPSWENHVHDAGLFLQMNQAVRCVFQALEKGEMITVHGDYDADGVTGSVVLMSTLRDICRRLQEKIPGAKYHEKNLSVYLPHREKEGYGLTIPTVELLHNERQTKVIITVDCGISNNEAITRAAELGMHVIVCDHHTMPTVLPTEAILIHPLVPGEPYPNKSLCGCGVAFKLATMLIREARIRGVDLPQGYEKWLLDLVAIATVTDFMPLIGENRLFEYYGLQVLQKTRRLGLQKLLDISGAAEKKIDTGTIGFQLGPRINAAGRMDHANGAFHLLMEEDSLKVDELTRALDQTNRDRQKASEKMYQAAKEQIGDPAGRTLLVAVGDGWSAGLVGLVAGKLLGDFSLPVLVIGKEGDKFVGSGRSIEGCNITEALHVAAPYLDRFGGHPQACGFSTTGEKRFVEAIDAMRAHVASVLEGVDLTPVLSIDAQLAWEDISFPFYEQILSFEPFGQGNPKPRFLSRRLSLLAVDLVGKTKTHLRFTGSAGGKIWKGIGFGLGHHLSSLSVGNSVDVVYEIEVNEWNGRKELQLMVVDIRKSENM